MSHPWETVPWRRYGEPRGEQTLGQDVMCRSNEVTHVQQVQPAQLENAGLDLPGGSLLAVSSYKLGSTATNTLDALSAPVELGKKHLKSLSHAASSHPLGLQVGFS